MTNDITFSERLRNLPQYLLPQRFISGCAYRLTRIRAPWFKNRFIAWFIKTFGVDMSEAKAPDYRFYEHFNAFFTRELKPGLRPIAEGDNRLCCPVDGAVSQAGEMDRDTIFQAKGQSYSLTRLLGENAERAQAFLNGSFITLYLSPRDYHRIHMPVDGVLREMVHVPGKLFSVSPLTTRVVPGLFARNERVVTIFDTAAGPMAMVLVGAINVSSIETVWAGEITPPRVRAIRHWRYDGAIKLGKGAEAGRFNMGSTVIVIFAKNAVRWHEAIKADAQVRMGQLMAERYVIGDQDNSG